MIAMDEKINYIIGMRPVIEAVRAGKKIEKVFFKSGMGGDLFAELVTLLRERNIAFQFVPLQRLEKISRGRHQGVIAQISTIDYISIEEAVENALKTGSAPIFVLLDGVSDNPEKRKRQEGLARYLRRKLDLLSCPMRLQHTRDIPHAVKYKIKYPRLQDKARIYRVYEDLFRQNDAAECDYVATSTFRIDSKSRDRHIYDETMLMDFEFMKLPVPSGYDKLLTLLYGDYMTPVVSPSMHGTLILDPDTPADIKIKELRKGKCKR